MNEENESKQINDEGLDGQEVDQGSTDERPQFRIPRWWLFILLLLLVGLAGQVISYSCSNVDPMVNDCFP